MRDRGGSSLPGGKAKLFFGWMVVGRAFAVLFAAYGVQRSVSTKEGTLLPLRHPSA